MDGGVAKTVALVVAAGRGLRAGTALPKQYAPVLGRPLLAYTLAALAGHPRIDTVVTVVHPDDRTLYGAAAHGLDLLPAVDGGASRQNSVLKGLESLEGSDCETVLIHDGARPFVSPALIDRLLDRLATADGVIPAIAVVDSLKTVDGGIVMSSQPRNGLFRAQTPQAFKFAKILAAHRAVSEDTFTDDAAIMEAAAGVVAVVDGGDDNIKVTEPGDFARAEAILLGRHGDVRSGFGVDVHGFGDGDAVTLCGVTIPHDRGLAGHSDADVALHALTDAVLGALAAGDIGDHFPPTDKKWQDAPSRIFLEHARDLVAERGELIAHVDVTIICEAPKVGPHRQAMQQAVSDMLRVAPDRVSVKATTTEKLGFTGRGEGIAAQAVATIRLPVGTRRDKS